MPGPRTASTATRRRAWSSRRSPAPPPTSTPTSLDAAGLQSRIATPGGLTEQGLKLLEERGLRDDFRAVVDLVVEKSS